MKKNLFLRLCLVITVALFLNSCRQDIFPEQETYNNSSAFQLTSKRISLDESKHKAQLLPELKKAEIGIESFAKNDIQGKVVNFGNGVSIDTENVIYIENGPNYHTYTFNIKRENAPIDALLENLVLSPLTDGTYKELLFVYNFTPQEKQSLAVGNGVDTKGKVTITELNKGTYNSGGLINKTTSWTCGYVDETIWESCYSGDHNGSNVETWGSCDATATGQRPPKVYTISVYKCSNVEDPNNPSVGNPVATGPGYAGNPGSPAIEQPGTPSNCTNPTVLSGPQDPSTGTGDGGCVGVPTLPNLELGNSSTPCTQLQSLKNNTGFTDKMNTLKSNIPNGAVEKGFVLHDDPTALTSPVVEGGGNNGNVSFADYYKLLQLQNINLLFKSYGTAHNHLASNPEHIGIFTPGDLNELLWSGAIETSVSNPFRKNKPENAIDIAITSIGLFAMKITDMAKLDAFGIKFTNMIKNPDQTQYNDFMAKFSDPQKYNIQPTSTYEQQVTGFLRFMQDEDLGIELYEGNKDTYGSWKKLELINNGNGTFSFSKIPCNL